MDETKEKIDLLLDENAAQQLGRVDWDKLDAAISSRLDEGLRVFGWPRVLKIASGIAAVAAVVLIAMIIRTDDSDHLQVPEGRRAIVKLIDKEGTASVQIQSTINKARVTVGIAQVRTGTAIVAAGRNQRALAKCDVEIHDLNGSAEKDCSPAAWIIIKRSEPLVADNGLGEDMMDMLSLF